MVGDIPVPHTPDLSIPIIMLAAAVVVTSVMQRMRVSPIIGYLMAGLLIGPYGMGWIQNTDLTRFLAELGVVFLLFAIGLELPIERLRVMRRYVFGFGGFSTLIVMTIFGLLAIAVGFSIRESLVVGGALCFSSTALILQLLSEKGEFSSRQGRAAFSAALFQDLLVVPLLVIVPLLTLGHNEIMQSVIAATVKATLALIVIMFLGRLLLRPFYRIVIGNRNHELFTAMTLLVVLGLSVSTFQFGLSMALGAFLAGVILSETEFRHQIAADIEPFRGLLLGLFFMTVGMMIDTSFLVAEPLRIFAMTAVLIGVKFCIYWAVARIYELPNPKAVKTAILLSQGGEFAFVLLGLAIYHEVLSLEDTPYLYMSVILSMVATPLLVRFSWKKLTAAIRPQEGTPEDYFDDRTDHVIVMGYGRVGEIISLMLAEKKIPYMVIDEDHDRVTKARARDLPVFYGDATKPPVLRAAGAESARAVVVAVSASRKATAIVKNLRENYPNLPVFVRARDIDHAKELQAHGVTATVPITLHASFELGSTLLMALGLESAEVIRLVHQLRESRVGF